MRRYEKWLLDYNRRGLWLVKKTGKVYGDMVVE
jgi:hypothetical protein